MSKRDYKSYKILDADMQDDLQEKIRQTSASRITEHEQISDYEPETETANTSKISLKKDGDSSVDTAKEKSGDGSADTAKEKSGDGSADTAKEKSGDGSADTAKEKNGDGFTDTAKRQDRANLNNITRQQGMSTTDRYTGGSIGKVLEDKKENITARSQTQEESMHHTSFMSYKQNHYLKKTSGLMKWVMRLMKLIVFCMLLPFIGIMLSIMAAGVISIGAVVAVCIGVGVMILGVICFMSSQISGGLIALGISGAITLLSLAGIIIVLSIMFIKWVIKIVKKRRYLRSKRRVEGEQY